MEKQRVKEEILYKIGLSLLPGIGPKKARNLVSYVGSVEGIFKEKKSVLSQIPGIGTALAAKINDEVLARAEKEIEFIEKNSIQFLFYLDDKYPKKLTYFDDSPIALFVKGNIDFNRNRFISIVGTRSMTHYGEDNCKKLVEDIKEMGFSPVITSGLAYGIDYCAHSTALKNSLMTVAVLGHGLDIIYPAAHRAISEKIIDNGALITEFAHKSKVDPANFVRRNRIIAAISDATIVVESAKKGGSLITAEYGVQYSKDVFAFPGRVGDVKSEGCNFLIKTNRAAMIENADDLIYALGWEKRKKEAKQASLFVELTAEEEKIVEVLREKELTNVDEIAFKTRLPINKVLALLFNLEFKNAVKALPGRMYKLLI